MCLHQKAVKHLIFHSFLKIGDKCTGNGTGNMAKFLSEIYPEGLQPNRENSSFEQAKFLELNIDIIDKQFGTSLHDKRDDFPFTISINFTVQPSCSEILFGKRLSLIALRPDFFRDRTTNECRQQLYYTCMYKIIWKHFH